MKLVVHQPKLIWSMDGCRCRICLGRVNFLRRSPRSGKGSTIRNGSRSYVYRYLGFPDQKREGQTRGVWVCGGVCQCGFAESWPTRGRDGRADGGDGGRDEDQRYPGLLDETTGMSRVGVRRGTQFEKRDVSACASRRFRQGREPRPRGTPRVWRREGVWCYFTFVGRAIEEGGRGSRMGAVLGPFEASVSRPGGGRRTSGSGRGRGRGRRRKKSVQCRSRRPRILEDFKWPWEGLRVVGKTEGHVSEGLEEGTTGVQDTQEKATAAGAAHCTLHTTPGHTPGRTSTAQGHAPAGG